MDNKRKWPLLKPDARRKRIVLKVLRGALVIAAVAIALSVASRVAAPYLISSSVVRSAMERAVAQWTGHRATIKGTPELQFWPEPRITLADVTISKDSEGGTKMLGHVGQLSAEFGLYDAIRGRPVFRNFRFHRPEIFIDRAPDGRLDWASEGMLSAAVQGVQALGADRQSLAADLDARIGTVTVDDGIVVLRDEATDKRFAIDGISADITWPRLSAELTAYLILRLGDRDIRLDVSSTQPLLLFAGQDARARATLQAQALTGSFDGVANLANGYFLSGPIELASTDMPALIAWSGAALPGTEALKQASLQATLTKLGSGLRFEDLRVALNDIHATGIMEMTPPTAGKPRISGTFAFDQLDIGALLGAFSLHLPFAQTAGDPATNGLLQWLDFDLSLSAEQAQLQPFTLQKVAASILASDGQAKFDIADSLFEGGQLTGQMVGSRKGFEGGGKLQISARDVDLANVIRQLNLAGPLPSARGSLDLSLQSTKPLWATGLEDISGTFQLHADAGSLLAVDADAIRRLAAEHPYFRLSEAGTGTFDFNSIDLTSRFDAGAADITRATLIGTSETLSMTGIVPYASNSLALSATLAPNDAAGLPGLLPLRFFIGGSWPDPILSPVQSSER